MASEALEPFQESTGRTLEGRSRLVATALAIGLSLYSLYWVLFIVQPQIYRVSFLLVALVLIFLRFPWRADESSSRVPLTDWLLIAATIVALAWPILDFSRFVYRAADPSRIDVVLGAVTILLVLEATRRSVGWILPATAVAFMAYGWGGPIFDRIGLSLIAHRGYEIDRLVGTIYMTLEGIFGVPLDVATTYIILFTIYGAVLEQSGAGRFFIDWSLAAMGRSGSGAAPGRTVTLAGFLLGTVSGSGVATTVMLGSVSWPLLRSAGYRPEIAGAILSAAGIGALISPPTLGAAAFLIAEFLQISYLRVLVMATIPTILYYLSIFLMIEADSRRLGTRAHAADVEPAGVLFRKYGYHFSSLVAIAAFMVAGMSAFRAVFWATALAVGQSYLRRDTALTPRRLLAALESGATGVLGVCATTATAGIIVGIVTLTGLGLKISGLIVALAGGHLFLTVVYSALAVWMLGLAVPVTASYIIAAVMVAPALVQAGRPRRCRPYVHLLLRRAVRGQSADRAFAVRRRSADWRQSLRDDDADLEVHVAGFPRPVRVHVDRRWRRHPDAGNASRNRHGDAECRRRALPRLPWPLAAGSCGRRLRWNGAWQACRGGSFATPPGGRTWLAWHC